MTRIRYWVYPVMHLTKKLKKAYRALSRKYHPDANVNNPNKEQAEEKFKEIQQAYQRIMDERQHGTSSSYSGSSGSGSYGGGYQDYGGFGDFEDLFGSFGFGGQSYRRQQSAAGGDEYTVHMNAAFNYIQSRHFREALNVLSGISERTAKWYYYSSIANSGLGNNVIAWSMQRKQRRWNRETSSIEYGSSRWNPAEAGIRPSSPLTGCRLWTEATGA